VRIVTGINRNVVLLTVCQALFMTTTSAVIASIALIGYSLAVDKTLATLPIAFQFIATMATSIPASLYMQKVGRRTGFVTGTVIGAVGASIAIVAIFQVSFWLFALGAALIGSFNSFAQFFRFAAADSADSVARGRAISLVLAGGLVAAVTGPNLANLTKDLFAPATYAGIFAAVIVLYATIAFVVSFLRIPTPSRAEQQGPQRPLFEILRQPKCFIAILSAVVGYLAMSFLMTVTPLAMADCGFAFGDSAMVIQGHIVGMFLPSFFTGHLIVRYGVLNVMICGALLQILCIAINLLGIDFFNFFSALVLVGLGWNFLFIGGTTLLTECYAPAERAKTQGFNDFCIWGAVAVGAVFSGASIHLFGWDVVNIIVLPFVLIAIGSLVWLRIGLTRAELPA
jgi:predicted MFS family arabinose efflux permease